MIRLPFPANPTVALFNALLDLAGIRQRLYGTRWINEPGAVILYSFETKRNDPFHYTHWRERSLFRGKSYRRAGKA